MEAVRYNLLRPRPCTNLAEEDLECLQSYARLWPLFCLILGCEQRRWRKRDGRRRLDADSLEKGIVDETRLLLCEALERPEMLIWSIELSMERRRRRMESVSRFSRSPPPRDEAVGVVDEGEPPLE